MGEPYIDNLVESVAVAAGETLTSFTQTPFQTQDCRLITLSVKVTVPTGASGKLTLGLGSWNTADWDNIPFDKLEMDLSEIGTDAGSGNKELIQSFMVEIGEGRKVKILSFENGDSTNALTVDYVKVSKLFG